MGLDGFKVPKDGESGNTDYGTFNMSSEWAGECTWWVDARLHKLGFKHHIWSADSWESNYASKGYTKKSSAAYGRIACWNESHYHVAFCESSSQVSSINIGGSYGDADSRNGSGEKVMVSSISGVFKDHGTPDFYIDVGGSSGGGGGEDPDDPDEPKGYWVYDSTGWQWDKSHPGEYTGEQSRTVYRYYDYSLNKWSDLSTSKPD